MPANITALIRTAALNTLPIETVRTRALPNNTVSGSDGGCDEHLRGGSCIARPTIVAYFALLTRISTAALTSASEALAAPPFGGIAFLPLMALT